MIAFKMDVNSSLLSDSDISDAQSRFNRANRFSNFYLRGRGLRLFKPIGTSMTSVNYQNYCVHIAKNGKIMDCLSKSCFKRAFVVYL